MAFDKSTRKRLADFVSDARGVIADEFTEQFQSLYGISAKGEIAPLDKLGHLDESGLATAALLRERIDYLEKTHPDDKDGTKAAVARLAREQAFTVLNRLAAIRMAEKRGLIAESVGQGYQSRGFKVFETVAGSALGDTYHRYRRYLFCLFDELAIDLGILFDRRSPQALLFPREPALLALLDLLHAADLEPLWAEDETIGWIYQYYNDPEERKKMRKESAAPRNSRELAVRNQFFTPRYVVEFLTDNTLGRIWYEMSGGATSLKDQCRYLVRRPTEIFLAEGETAPETPDQEGLSQEELLKQPVHIPHRPLKDPREIRLLDPACGSMHFGLYAFDLFETIYEEAWDNGSCPALQEAYPSKDEFLKDVPRLIIEHNIHGIDIDPRAVQIAGLSLWLRAQKAWQARGVKPADRPRVRRSNIVCAEPMPGSPEMLESFIANLDPSRLGDLVRTVFDKMQLAGEAGSLLKIEEEIRTAIDSTRKEWLKQQDDLLTRKDGSQEEFFDTAEQQVIDALRAYAEQADADSYQRRLFADDAARGFAFIDLCRKRYDAVVMNPPFGDISANLVQFIKEKFRTENQEFYACFIQQSHEMLDSVGRLGVICGRPGFYAETLELWREDILKKFRCHHFVDLGGGVLDAMVETAASVWEKGSLFGSECRTEFYRVNAYEDKGNALHQATQEESSQDRFVQRSDYLQKIPNRSFAYWLPAVFIDWFANSEVMEKHGLKVYIGVQTDDDFRFSRLHWEVSRNNLIRLLNPDTNKTPDQYNLLYRELSETKSWATQLKGSDSHPFFADFPVLVNWESNGAELKAFAAARFGNYGKRIYNEPIFFEPGFSWSIRTDFFSPHVVPPGCIPTVSRYLATHANHKELLPFIAALNSDLYEVLIRTQMGKWTQPLYKAGVIERLPLLAFDSKSDALKEISEESIEAMMACSEVIETSNLFTVSILENHKVPEAIESSQQKIADALIKAGCASAKDVQFATSEVQNFNQGKSKIPLGEMSPATADRLSYCLGTALGRWDIRYATGERQPPELPDPFDPLPVCPPGMLQNAEGLPAEPKDVPAAYPLRISWPGILVDDENQPEDIVARVREAIEVIWKDRAEAIEQEACEILGVKTLRDYFRRPAAFFADHLKRYSKSRRQAPIYWPLSTKSGSYTLWLYYHRLTDQTLHTCLADFLDPKIRKVQSELDALTGSGGGGTRAGELREFLDELHDLRDEIERVIKLPWKPNLNDGVLITASPLHKLFRLPKWQKDLKACWDKLAKGDFDWAHLAYTIRPREVEKACEKDRSIAIAHNREDLCKVEPPKPKKKRGKKAAEEEPEEDEPQLIEED